uniref:Variant surface glycoprotein 1125.5057 n=1 Tax=Trypanosoma brucei TaxID=5691 RepID=A0A1J0RBR3_9TRYP|nr:variant surface glycoprotein 1125.5057 [Trypanosoma brucei]
MTKRICYNNHVSVLALLILSGLSGAQDRIDEDADKVKKPCQKLHFIRKARDALSGTLQNALMVATNLITEAKVFTLAACTADDAPAARAYSFLAALATERAKKAQIDAEKSRKLLAQPMAVFQRREGQIEAVLAAQPDTITFPTAPTPGSTQAAQMGSATGKKCDITFKATSTAVPTCMDSDRNKEAIEKTAAKIKTLIKVKLTPDVAFSGGTFKISIAASGTVKDIDQPANTDNDACATTSSGTPNTKAGANHALGILSVQREQTDYTAEETDVVPEVGANDGRCKKDETASTSLHVTQKQMAHAICKWQEATAVAAAEVSGQKIQDLSEQSDAQQLAQIVLTGEIKDDLTDAAKKKLVIDILGDKEKTINDRFLTPIEYKKQNSKSETNRTTKI